MCGTGRRNWGKAEIIEGEEQEEASVGALPTTLVFVVSTLAVNKGFAYSGACC